MVRTSLLLLISLQLGLSQSATFYRLDIRGRQGLAGVPGELRFWGLTSGNIIIRASNVITSYSINLPNAAAPVGGAYFFCDQFGSCSWQNPTAGGGGVTTVTASLPIVSSGGATPNISCPTCLRTDLTSANIPIGSIDIGSTGTWWNAMYAGTFQVTTGPSCVNSAFMSATSLFGGQIFVKNGSCVVSAEMNNNGVNISGTGSFRASGNVVIDASRNATVNNLTILGTCTGCPGGGGGGGVNSVGAIFPVISSGGTNPVISCPNCVRTDTTMTPNFGVDLGTAANWWNNMYSGSFIVSVGPTCTAAAMVTATALFGGDITVRTGGGGCTVSARMNNNGVYVPQQAAISGQRYACIDTTGRIVSSVSACSGT